ncbi:hypothetical protein ACTFIZ_007094 [Dictyostelium cf. discoideum]
MQKILNRSCIHDFHLLPVTHIEAPIKSVESKYYLFIKRKPSQSLEELHKLMDNMFETKSNFNSCFDIPFKDRENQFKKSNIIPLKYNKQRVNHYILQCLTGSGIGKKLKNSNLEQVTKFPLINYTKGTSFEENTAILIQNQINTFVKSSNNTVSKLFEFFPFYNDITHEFAFSEIKICKIELYQNTSKWLYRSTSAIRFGLPKTEHIYSNNTETINLLGNGNTSFDIRIFFELLYNGIGKNHLMVVINTKFSSSDTYLGNETIEKIFKNCEEAFILPILITNFKVKQSNVEDNKGKLWHRTFFEAHDKRDFISPNLFKEFENISL